MEFSPRLGDILVKSDMVQGPATTQPVSASVPTWRLERSITEFTKLDDGHFVPKVFLMTRSQNGQVDERLERRVSKAALGKVPNSLFNFKEQLSGPWDSTVDGPTQTDVSSTTKSAGQ
jgi:hypothetical protein